MARPQSMGKTAQERRAKLRKEQQLRTGYVRPSRAKPKTGWTCGKRRCRSAEHGWARGGATSGRTRFELGLGLELAVRDDASSEIRALAARIRSLCG